MPRPPDLWLRKRDKCWMATLNDRQHKLAKDKAHRLLYALLGAPPAGTSGPVSSGLTLAGLCDEYLDKTAGKVGAERWREGEAVTFAQVMAVGVGCVIAGVMTGDGCDRGLDFPKVRGVGVEGVDSEGGEHRWPARPTPASSSSRP